MNLLEFQAKELLRNHLIHVPRGFLVHSPAEARKCAESLGLPVVFKAQIPSGRRGKRGLIQFVETPSQAESKATYLFEQNFEGQRIPLLLVEEKLEILKELYLAVTVDEERGLPLLLFSLMGGMDVEERAEQSPGEMVKIFLPYFTPLWGYQVVDALRKTPLPGEYLGEMAGIMKRLYDLVCQNDAILAEINPLAITRQAKIIAADAKIVIDDAALFRQQGKFSPVLAEGPSPLSLEKKAGKEGMSFVPLGGDIGVVAGGAGLAMTTIDMIAHYGGKAANFLDTMGATREKIRNALRIVLSIPGLRGVITNNAAGLSSCSDLASGILEVIQEDKPKVPLVVKLRGKGEEESWSLLESHGVKVVRNHTTEEAVQMILRLVQSKE